jgi:hypothetical protein
MTDPDQNVWDYLDACGEPADQEMDEEFQAYFEDVELTPEQIEEIRRRKPIVIKPSEIEQADDET